MLTRRTKQYEWLQFVQHKAKQLCSLPSQPVDFINDVSTPHQRTWRRSISVFSFSSLFFPGKPLSRSVLVLTTCHHNNLQPFYVQILCNPSLFHIILDTNLILCILNHSWWNLVEKPTKNLKRGEQSCLYYVEQIVTMDLFCLSCKPTFCYWLVVPVTCWPCQLFVCISIPFGFCERSRPTNNREQKYITKKMVSFTTIPALSTKIELF